MPGDELRVGQVTDVAAVGGFGYAALVGTGIFEFDPRDIRVLVGRRELRLAGLVRRVEAAPTRAVNEPGAPQEQARLLAAAGEGGVYWLDVDAPPSPPTATPRPTGAPSPTPFFPAYVPWAGTGREEPPFVLAEQGALSAEALGGREVTGVALHGARAVVGLSRVRGGEDAGLAVLALDESPPRLVGRHEQLAVAPRDLAFDGERVTVAAWTDGLRMLRLDGLGRFEPLGGLSMTLRAAHLAAAPSAGAGGEPGGGASGEGADVADVLYVAGTRLDPGPRAGLVAVDAADPSALAALGAVRVPDVTALARGDGALYALDYTAGLRVLDVSDPLTLTEAALLPLPGAVDVAADGRGRVVLAVRTNGGAIDGGLIVLDAADPLSPTVAGRWRRGVDEPGAWARFVALSEVADVDLGAGAVSGGEVLTRTVAWLAGERDLHVVDVSDPAAPLLLAAKRLEPGGVIGLAVQGRRAVLLHRTRGAVVLALE
jgi:hypothetical protein